MRSLLSVADNERERKWCGQHVQAEKKCVIWGLWMVGYFFFVSLWPQTMTQKRASVKYNWAQCIWVHLRYRMRCCFFLLIENPAYNPSAMYDFTCFLGRLQIVHCHISFFIIHFRDFNLDIYQDVLGECSIRQGKSVHLVKDYVL